jgi:diguanylate cyclase (GGDEF)-like protein
MRTLLDAADLAVATRVEVPRIADAWPALGDGDADVAVVALPSDQADGMLAFTRLQAAIPDVPFVVVVDAARERDGLEALRFGAQEFLVRERLDAGAFARALRCAVARHRHLAVLRDLSFTDPLTGLHNRRGFHMLADAHLQLARRNGRTATLLYADVDGLKVINDVYGHAEGDRALVRVARALRGTLRRSDLVARIGGDEFVALLLDGGAVGVGPTLQRVRDALQRDVAPGPLQGLALSIGHAVLEPGAEIELGELLSRADRQLYRSRRRRGTRPDAPSGRRAATGSARSAA